MPNWCNNKLVIDGPEGFLEELRSVAEATPDQEQVYSTEGMDPELVKIMEETSKKPSLFSFHRLVPVPNEVLAQAYDPAGYDWEGKNWGCKWGCSDVTIVDEGPQLVYEFSTPWSPPLKFLDTLAKKWPGLGFYLTYDEPDMDIEGTAGWNEGVIDTDHWTGHAEGCLIDAEGV